MENDKSFLFNFFIPPIFRPNCQRELNTLRAVPSSSFLLPRSNFYACDRTLTLVSPFLDSPLPLYSLLEISYHLNVLPPFLFSYPNTISKQERHGIGMLRWTVHLASLPLLLLLLLLLLLGA